MADFDVFETELICALDFDSLSEVRELVDHLDDTVNYYKVGKQLFTNCGPEVLRVLQKRDKKIFLDLKFHDIPNTVAQAVRAGVEQGVEMIDVHAAGGREMIAAAVEAATTANPDALLIAVTVLTSLDQDALREIGIDATPEDQVRRLAKLAQAAGAHGVVASAKESRAITEACGPEFVQVLPGIRAAGAGNQDQKRVVTATHAAVLGADYIVVGRPITRAPEPKTAAEAILQELATARTDEQ